MVLAASAKPSSPAKLSIPVQAVRDWCRKATGFGRPRKAKTDSPGSEPNCVECEAGRVVVAGVRAVADVGGCGDGACAKCKEFGGCRAFRLQQDRAADGDERRPGAYGRGNDRRYLQDAAEPEQPGRVDQAERTIGRVGERLPRQGVQRVDAEELRGAGVVVPGVQPVQARFGVAPATGEQQRVTGAAVLPRPVSSPKGV